MYVSAGRSQHLLSILTAFSKKQTSVSMSSTEAEVVSANVSLRAVGLPSSGLWSYLQQAGGVQKPCIPGGLPDNDVETAKEPNGEHWIFQRSRRLLIRVHTKPRNHLFSPESSMKSSPCNPGEENWIWQNNHFLH